MFGTLVTDNLTDNLGVPLEVSTVVFGVLLAADFVAWYRVERTLSIHSIFTRRREAFYWLAILFTFALGTATGDLMAQVLGLGYLVSRAHRGGGHRAPPRSAGGSACTRCSRSGSSTC